jgi:hypothetical protein
MVQGGGGYGIKNVNILFKKQAGVGDNVPMVCRDKKFFLLWLIIPKNHTISFIVPLFPIIVTYEK